jgi:hypothetical protein
MSVNDYMSRIDLEYPAFSRRMYMLLRELRAEGKTIIQVEPYIAALIEIHEHFAEGHGPRDLDRNTLHYPVYLAERNATGALLSYYSATAEGSFDECITSMRHFARLDAARFRLRDSLRAQALAPLFAQFPSAFIEAGAMHYYLHTALRRALTQKSRLRLVFQSNAALKSIGRNGHLYGPGDQLTLLYIFHPSINKPDKESLLASRALVHAKLAIKEEIDDDDGLLPHAVDELACMDIVNRLSIEDCERLFSDLRNSGTERSRQIVNDFLAKRQ